MTSEYARYIIECWLVNVSKLIIIYLTSASLHIVFETLIAHISFLVIRYFSHGWHASKNIICTVLSVALFVVLLYLSIYASISPVILAVISTANIVVLAIFAPADSQANRIENAKLRTLKKIGTITFLLILISFYFKSIQIFIVYGITLATFFVVLNIFHKEKVEC